MKTLRSNMRNPKYTYICSCITQRVIGAFTCKAVSVLNSLTCTLNMVIAAKLDHPFRYVYTNLSTRGFS